MAECDSRSGCTGIQYDCNIDCKLMVDVICGTELQTACGSSLYYKAGEAATTTVPQGGLNCYENAVENGLFNCQPESYCSNQFDALRLGTMSLDACMRQCLLYDCGAIQYDCNTDCWLLRTCDSYVTTSCGSSVYLRDSQGWPAATTTTTTIFGACFPSTEMSYDFVDFSCQPAVYCENQAYARMFGAMTIHQWQGKTIIAQAICSDLVETHSEGNQNMTTGELWVECSDGSAVSCNCWTAWRVTDVCGEGRGTFAPTITAGNVPRCEQTIETSGDRGGIRKYSASYLWSSDVITSDDSVQYCGWSQDLYLPTPVGVLEADCRAWMIEDHSSVGGCKSTECTRLSDAWQPPDPETCADMSHESGLFCIMVSSTDPGVNTILDQPPDVMVVGSTDAAFYVNTRTGTVAVRC
eukprot:s522_g21.t1